MYLCEICATAFDAPIIRRTPNTDGEHTWCEADALCPVCGSENRFHRAVRCPKCGEWMRIVKTDSTLFVGQNNAAVFLDPPYSTSHDLYAECADVTESVREWCVRNGGRKNVRIALCGYNDDHDALLSHG